MKNWFKKKTKKEKLEKEIVEWYEEKESKRACFCVLLDEDAGITTGAIYGIGNNIIDALINEMMAQEGVAELVLQASKDFLELTAPKEEVVEEKPKRKRKKSDKIVS